MSRLAATTGNISQDALADQREVRGQTLRKNDAQSKLTDQLTSELRDRFPHFHISAGTGGG